MPHQVVSYLSGYFLAASSRPLDPDDAQGDQAFGKHGKTIFSSHASSISLQGLITRKVSIRRSMVKHGRLATLAAGALLWAANKLEILPAQLQREQLDIKLNGSEWHGGPQKSLSNFSCFFEVCPFHVFQVTPSWIHMSHPLTRRSQSLHQALIDPFQLLESYCMVQVPKPLSFPTQWFCSFLFQGQASQNVKKK